MSATNAELRDFQDRARKGGLEMGWRTVIELAIDALSGTYGTPARRELLLDEAIHKIKLGSHAR